MKIHAALLIVPLVALAACEKKPAPGAGSTAAPSAAAPAAKPAAKVDWAKVNALDTTRAMEPACRLCRLIDVHHKGASPVTLTYTGSAATDGAGATYPITPEEWKGIATMASANPSGKSAARALPGANSYHDGLGPAKRHAYWIQKDSDNALTFTVAKELEDSSNG